MACCVLSVHAQIFPHVFIHLYEEPCGQQYLKSQWKLSEICATDNRWHKRGHTNVVERMEEETKDG